MIEVWTDGACRFGFGGWGWITDEDPPVKASGAKIETTNQQMELTAVVNALSTLCPGLPPGSVTVVSDSAYVVNGMNQGWYNRWQANGWKNGSGEPVANQELWEQLIWLKQTHDPAFRHVRGHAGWLLNEAADALAVSALKELRGRS